LSASNQLQQRLLEIVRFDSGEKARAESLLVLAMKKDPAHIKIFKEALLDRRVSIQFAGLEALEAWALPEAVPYLLDAARRGWSPLIRVYAAQAAWRLGDPEGKRLLMEFLSSPDWLMRAMSARYMGDLGTGADADMILDRIGREQDNDFALAENCIAGLKLLGRRTAVAPPPPPQPRPAPRRTPVPVSGLFELEPLVVTAPRVRLSGGQLVDPRIDSRLVYLLDRLASESLPDMSLADQSTTEVDQLVTPRGYGLKLRYSNIYYLLTEGLAGTSNLTLVSRIETIARTSPNRLARALALVALGYDQTRTGLGIFSDALREPETFLRFGAVEGLAQQNNPLVRGVLADVSQSDPSPIVRLFAAQALGQRGDVQAVDTLRRNLGDPDPVTRSLAVYFLGTLGDEGDFERLLMELDRETDDQVTAETCLAVLRLSR